MKILLLFLASLPAFAQATILGPLYDASGALANCQLTIRPKSVPGYSPAPISYTVWAGDLSGSTGGYGTGFTNIWRHAALDLYPGTYSTLMTCPGGRVATKTYPWTVAGSAISIQVLLGGTAPGGRTWNQMTTTWAGTSGSWAVQ